MASTATYAWAGWLGVSVLGAGVSAVGLGVWMATLPRRRRAERGQDQPVALIVRWLSTDPSPEPAPNIAHMSELVVLPPRADARRSRYSSCAVYGTNAVFNLRPRKRSVHHRGELEPIQFLRVAELRGGRSPRR